MPSSKLSAPTITFKDGQGKSFAVLAMVWGVISLLLVILVRVMILNPAGFGNPIWIDAEYLTTGRWLPVVRIAATYGLCGNAIFSIIYLTVPRLCQRSMASLTLGMIHIVGWQLVVLAGCVSIPLGMNQSRPMAEMEWSVDIAIAIVWIVFFGGNLFLTIANRAIKPLFVSLWFYIAAWIGFAVIHIANAISIPVTGVVEGLKTASVVSLPMTRGATDAWLQSWYVQGVEGFLLTLPIFGALYFVIPMAANRPIYSYKGSVIHFWSSLLLISFGACQTLQYSAIPEWLQSLGFLSNLLYVIISFGAIINLQQTLSDELSVESVSKNSLEWIELSLRSYKYSLVVGLILCSPWTSAWMQHSQLHELKFYLLTLGWCVPTLMAAIAVTVQAASVSRHQRILRQICEFGLFGVMVFLATKGASQAYRWNAIDENGQPLFASFLDTVVESRPTIFLAGLIILVIGFVFLGIYTVRLWLSVDQESDVDHAYTLQETYLEETSFVSRPSELTGVLELGKAIDVWSRLDWHYLWETRLVKMAMMITTVIVFASALQFGPLVIQDYLRANSPAVASVVATSTGSSSPNASHYTPLELIGREMFRAEGCVSCHTQMVRPLIAETTRFGNFSIAADSESDRPVLWGEQRRGPDLAREGGKQSNWWHYEHLISPNSLSKGSIMPGFPHLANRDLDPAQWSQRLQLFASLDSSAPLEIEATNSAIANQALEVAATLVQQGGPANIQDRQIIALIAYLQRLGVALPTSPTTPPK